MQFNERTEYASEEAIRAAVARNAAEGMESVAYKWELPEKLLDVAPPEAVALLVRDVLRDSRDTERVLRSEQPKMSVEEIREVIRERLQARDPRFRDMATRTHPHLFTMLMDPALSEVNLRHIWALIQKRYVHEHSGAALEEKTQDITNYFRTHWWGGAPKDGK